MINFRKLALLAPILAIGAGTGFKEAYPETAQEWIQVLIPMGMNLWDKVETNPTPYVTSIGFFVLAVVIQVRRGKTIKEAVQAVVAKGPVTESDVVVRSRNRALKNQLLTDQIGLQNRIRKLPEEIKRAEVDFAHTQKDLRSAEENLKIKVANHKLSSDKLKALEDEAIRSHEEHAHIQTELNGLKDMV